MNNNLCLRQINNGHDQTRMGRWIWTLLRGRQGIQVRIVSGYRPIEDTSNRPFTVFSQQEYYYNHIDNSNGYRNPRVAFYEDLDAEMRSWLEAGDHIILGLDANEDIHAGLTREWTTRWGLVDGLQRLHPTLQRVATCNKNLSNVPIDGLWVSPSLNVLAAGMSGFGELYPDSDHRLLWVDIHVQSLFGFLTPLPEKRPSESLPIKDPRAMKKYNTYVKQQFHQHKIMEKTFELERKAQTSTFNREDISQYNQILRLQMDIRRKAKRKCRRFYTSKILFTADLGLIYRRRKLWKLLELKKNNKKVDLRAIRRLMRKVNEPLALQLPLPAIQEKMQEAIRDWKDYKKTQGERRDAFELEIDKRRATKFGTSVEAQTKQRKNAASTRGIFHKIRAIMKPREHIAINTVEYTAPDGTMRECLSRTEIEEACIAEGQRRFTQAQDTPFLQGSLLRDFGFNANREATLAVLNGTYAVDMDVTNITTRFIQELRMPHEITMLPPITGVSSTEEHCLGWQKMNSRTSSSPYGPLFCDYIAGAQDVDVASVDASLSSIP